jgi:short-subunit dehydrogenase
MRVQLKNIEAQVIVITGASSGIGLATAQMAAAKGAKLVLAARSEEALKRIVNDIAANGGDAIYVVADVGDEADVQRIADRATERFGGFDTWVNNAGVSIYGKLSEVPLDEQRRMFDTNYWGVAVGSIVAGRQLRKRGGAIINVGSILSERAIPLQGGYSASKHAVKGFTDALRMELEHDDAPVSVTLIKPGAIDTPYNEHAKSYLGVEPKHTPPVYPAEAVAEAILYAAENPVRDLYVGGAAKVIALAEKYTPRLTDKFMEAFTFETQRSNTPKDSDEPSSLEVPSGDGRVNGNYEGHVAQNSLYTKASIHPFVTGGLLLAGVGLAYAVAKARAA